MDKKNAISIQYYGEGYTSLQKYSSKIREMFSRLITEQKYYVNFDIGRQLCDVRFLQFYEIMNINRKKPGTISTRVCLWTHENMRFYRCPQGQNDDDSVTQLKQSGDCLGKNAFMIDHVFESGVGGGGRILNKCLYGEAPPRSPTPNLFLY